MFLLDSGVCMVYARTMQMHLYLMVSFELMIFEFLLLHLLKKMYICFEEECY